MRGTMMDFPLTLPHFLERAGRLFPSQEIVSRMPDKSLHRYRYADFHRRARALAAGLREHGLERGERVATLMWNHYAHLEAYFGVPCGGGVLHTLNLRLHPDDIGWIARHAGDRYLIVDDVLLPLYNKFRGEAPFERVFVVRLTGAPVPQGCEDYESLVAAPAERYEYPVLDENDAAGMCYTSGTTGRPKGVAYSHRALVLHSMAAGLVDTVALANGDSMCPVVPMFHVNAWALPFAAVMVGAKQVLPGPHLDGESLVDLFESEQVTIAAGVPTLWAGVLQVLEQAQGGRRLQPALRMIVGGAAAPESMVRAFDRHGLRIIHAWGMTETTPLGTTSYIKSNLRDADEDVIYALRSKQGLPAPLVEVRAMSDSGEAPWDGATMGELQVRGPWVAAHYHDLPAEGDKWTEDGWFRTGDIVTIDAEGYVKITDRAKDLIKSGGEWISSLDLEAALAAHPAVAEAAVIAVPSEKWGERPLAVVVLKPGTQASAEDLREHLAARVARWWLPDGFEFVDAIPRTSTGKMLKAKLRDEFQGWKAPGGSAA